MPKLIDESSSENKINNNKFNIADILILDHKYLKECINVLKDESIDHHSKITYGRSFLDTVMKHSEAEKKSVYAALADLEDVRFSILEGEIEHAIVDAKVKVLAPQLAAMETLSEEMEAELKVLSELVEHHLKEEEKEMIPKFRKVLEDEILNEMGIQFMKLRGFTEKDLEDYPELQEEVNQWKDRSHQVSGQFITKVHDYVNNLTH